MYDIIVIGGGASGMMAAITASRLGAKNVLILERQSRVGKKLLITGNGRCNISNADLDLSHFHSRHINTVDNVLNQFTLENTMDFFKTLGMLIKNENGKLFPYSLQASSVLDALRYECDRLGIVTKNDCFVTGISSDKSVYYSDTYVKGKCIIVACGGKAAPHTGSDGNGYKLLTKLGHTLLDPAPCIVPLRTELSPIKPLKGVKVDALLMLTSGNDTVSCRDEVLFTEYGISGPAAMKLSRFVSTEHPTDKISAVVDFAPDMEKQEVYNYLAERHNYVFNNVTENLTLGLLNKRVGQAVLKYSCIGINDSCYDLSEKQLLLLTDAIKKFKISVTGVCGYDTAQTTSGGIDLAEFSTNLESKITDGVFACGEMIDCDGDCGGYNLQWAWSSGYVAGKSAFERITRC